MSKSEIETMIPQKNPDGNVFGDILREIGLKLDDNTYNELEKLYNSGSLSIEELIHEANNIQNNSQIKKVDEQIKKDEKEERLKQLQKTEHLWISADEQIMPMLYCRTSIYLTIELCGRKIKCLLDTGAQNNILKQSIVDELKLQSFVDYGYKTKIIGVGENQSKSEGLIPYIECTIGSVNVPLYFQIMEKVTSYDAILGLPFMLFYRVQLDFATKKMKLMGTDVDMQVKEG